MGSRRIMKARGPRDGLKTTRIVVPRELQAGRRRLFYCEAGRGTPLVLIHGLGGSCRWWFPLFPELTSSGFRIVAPDLPGFGRSPGRMLLVADAARAVIELADRLSLARFFLCGHSMGGAIAARVAADSGGRVQRLVLVDSAGIPGVGGWRVMRRLLQPWSWCPPPFYSTLIGDMVRAGPRNLLAAMRHLNGYDVRPALERVRVPSLVIWGEKDALLPTHYGREIAAGLRDARLEVVPSARHLPMVSDPATVSRLIIDFFDEDTSRRA